MTTGERVRLKREELHLSQEELSAMLGYSNRSAISKIETAGDKISLKKVNRLADVLGVTPQWLMGWEEEEQNGAILGKIALNPELMNHVKKLMSLSPEQQGIVFNQIDYLYDKIL